MEQDLRENYGIYQTKMREGSFNSFYSGVKKDGDRVKEQMKQGEEADKKRLARKQADFQKKPVDHNRIQILKEHKAKKAYEKRTLALQE